MGVMDGDSGGLVPRCRARTGAVGTELLNQEESTSHPRNQVFELRETMVAFVPKWPATGCAICDGERASVKREEPITLLLTEEAYFERSSALPDSDMQHVNDIGDTSIFGRHGM